MGLADELHLRTSGSSLLGSVLGPGIRAIGSSRPGAWLFSHTLRHMDRATLTLSGNRTGVTDALGGLPTILLTTTGAKTGQARTSALIGVPAGEHLAVIGSNFGSPRHPGWVHNLLANPEATVSHRDRSVAVVAREAIGAEADLVWARGREMYHGFSTYPGRTGGREIRVFVLEPASGNPHDDD